MIHKKQKRKRSEAEAMFGRVRASSVPAESLERSPSKIFNDNSLSVYEATLMKLKLGSRRNPTPCSMEVGEMDADSYSTSLESEPFASSATSSSPDMTLDANCSSGRGSVSSSGCETAETLKQTKNSREVSVSYLFSKFKNARAHEPVSSSSSEAMTVDSVGAYADSSGDSRSVSTAEQWEEECINYLPTTEVPDPKGVSNVCENM